MEAHALVNHDYEIKKKVIVVINKVTINQLTYDRIKGYKYEKRVKLGIQSYNYEKFMISKLNYDQS